MSESKEEIDLLSEKELEDGEIEDGELDEPECNTTIDNQPELISTDIHDNSDVDINDKTFLKNKKHKHHKRGFHRKRHINSEETNDNTWKKCKNSNDEFDDYQSVLNVPNINNKNIINKIDNENCQSETFIDNFQNNKPQSDNKFKDWSRSDQNKNWGDYESDDDNNSLSKINFKQNISFESINKHEVSTSYEPENNIEPEEVTKWAYNSGDEENASTTYKFNTECNTLDNCNTNFKPFNSKRFSNYNKDNGKDWNNFSDQNNDDLNFSKNSNNDEELSNFGLKDKSPIAKIGWGSYDSPCDDDEKLCKKTELPLSPVKSVNESFGTWGSYESPEKVNDETPKWECSPRKNDDDSNEWNARSSPTKNDDNIQRWNSKDSPTGNDDESQRWGSRNGYRRNNFRRWGSRDGFRRNNNSRRWGSRNDSQRGNYQRWGSFNNNNNNNNNSNDNRRWDSFSKDSPQYNNDKRWDSNDQSPQQVNDNENSNCVSQNLNYSQVDDVRDVIETPEKVKWATYDSDEDQTQPENSNNVINDKDGTISFGFEVCSDKNRLSAQSNSKKDDNIEPDPVCDKWGCFDSDEEGTSTNNRGQNSNTTTDNSNKSTWKSFDNDDEIISDSFFENKNQTNYSNNSRWNRDDRNDFQNEKNEKSKRWINRNDGERRSVCKYFSMGSCRHGDRCTFLHTTSNKPVNQESKKKELCKFYEHQQCYKRVNCIYMHEEFPCKLFHAGSKMCPSGDSCKYSHAPLNQDTKTLLEKYLDEKVDERTDKIGSEWSSIIKKSIEDDIDDDGSFGFDQSDGIFSDSFRYSRYTGAQDLMRFPVRPWNAMMRYNMSMQIPHQMDFMHRQRFLCQYPMNTGRMFPRGFRNMVPPNIHEGFSNGSQNSRMPLYSIPPMIGANQKLHLGNSSELNDSFIVSDPYIDNLAQLVVSKDQSSSPKRLIDMLDPNIPCEDIDDFSLEIETCNSKTNLSSPVLLNSPEIPPGAYVPRTSMNTVQPNVRLGPGAGFGEQPMLYGGYPGHPNETAMMDYINLSAIHYFHNHGDPIDYDFPWKLLLLEVPVKIPYPLMVIETQDLPHKYTDPRLKGHPSVFNSNSTNNNKKSINQSYDFNSISTFGTQLSSQNFGTGNFETSETLTPLNDFLSRSEDLESPIFPIGDDFFNFKHKVEPERTSDRYYLQDPRFKRKKVIVNNTVIEQSDMME